MKNWFKDKALNSFFNIACILNLIGFSISSILFLKFNFSKEIIYIPVICSICLGLILQVIYIIFKSKYFSYIKMHVDKKYFNYEYASIVLYLFSVIITLILLVIFEDYNRNNNGAIIGSLVGTAILNIICCGLHFFSDYRIKLERDKKFIYDNHEIENKDEK